MVGGGATGVELAGALGELRKDVLRATFPAVDPERVHVRLIEMAPALLMPFHPKLREYARKQLVKRGCGHQAEHTDPRGGAGPGHHRRRAVPAQ